MDNDNIKLKRVLHCVGYMKKAGAETFIMNMYREIDRTKVQFDFFCCEKEVGDYDEEIRALGGRLFYLSKNETNHKIKIFKYFSKIKRFKNTFQSIEDIDIVHIHGHHAFDILIIVLAAKLSGFNRIIVHSHNAFAERHIHLHKISKIVLSRLKTTQLACSNMAGKWMFTNKKYTVIPNGISVEKFVFNSSYREKYRNEFDFKDGFVIGHIGRFEEQKNHTFIVKIFSEFLKDNSNSWLLLIGDGPLKGDIKKLVRNLEIHDKVIFAGVRSDVSKIYSAMDTFIFPSLYEGLGIVAIEAETSDLPCLFSDSLPNDVDISDKVVRCSLSQPIIEWKEALVKCMEVSQSTKRSDNFNLISNKGFNIHACCMQLYKIYIDEFKGGGISEKEI